MKFLGLKLRNNWDIEGWTCFSMIIKDYARTDIIYPEYDYNDIRILKSMVKIHITVRIRLYPTQDSPQNGKKISTRRFHGGGALLDGIEQCCNED